jgi:hypothetical protein
MGVGLRPTGKPVDMLPDPIAAAPRFYSTDTASKFVTKKPLTLHSVNIGGELPISFFPKPRIEHIHL